MGESFAIVDLNKNWIIFQMPNEWGGGKNSFAVTNVSAYRKIEVVMDDGKRLRKEMIDFE